MRERWYMIVNPVAGGGEGLSDFPLISRLLLEAGVHYKTNFTEHKFHAVELCVKAINEGYRKIIVVGGDGTLHEVVGGLFIQRVVDPKEVTLAVLAIGSGNDWVRTFGISNRYREAIEAIKAGYTLLQDVGKVSYEEAKVHHTKYMANVGGTGFDAAVVKKSTHLRKKGYRGKWIYYWSVLFSFFRYKPAGTKVWIDGKLVYNNLLLSSAIGICKYNGGGVQQLPEAVIDDGLFDITLIRPLYWWQIIFRLHYLFNGDIYRIGHTRQRRGRTVRIESIPEVSLEVDGEMLGESPFTFEVLDKAIRVIVSKEFLENRNSAER
ncbi:MAG: diacylglycerol kinase family protein [Rikenellaceae bacterium]